jgi:hypothetical protein
MNYFVYVDNILGVETNAKTFEFSYGTVAPASTMDEFNKCKIKLHINVVKDDDVFPADKEEKIKGKFHYFSANPGEHTIYYERNYFFGARLRYKINVEKNDVKVVVGKTYFEKVKHRVMNLHSMSYILTDVVAGLLLMNGYTTLHCSAVNLVENNRSVILFAPPNTGKTLSSMMICKNYNANFIAEDFAITDGVDVYAVPWTSTFRLYDEVNESKVEKAINKVTSVVPALELVKLTKNQAIDTYIGGDRILMRSKATDVVVLERGDSSVTYDKSDALRKLLTLNRYEFNYHKAPFMVVLSYFNPDFSIEFMYECERKIIGKLLDNTDYLCVTDMNAMNYSDIVYSEISKK